MAKFFTSMLLAVVLAGNLQIANAHSFKAGEREVMVIVQTPKASKPAFDHKH